MSQAMRSGSAGDAGALQALFSKTPGKAESVVMPINGIALGAHDGNPAFYCVHSLSGAAGTDFSVLARLMPDVRFYGVQAPSAKMQDADFGGSIEAIGNYYARALVLSQPEGPILLGGWSAGVTIGLETAENLRARGREVGLFVAIDAAPENTGANLPAWHPRYILEVLSNLRGWVTHDLLTQQHPLQSLFRRITALGKAAMDGSSDAKNAASHAVERFHAAFPLSAVSAVVHDAPIQCPDGAQIQKILRQGRGVRGQHKAAFQTASGRTNLANLGSPFDRRIRRRNAFEHFARAQREYACR